MFVLIPAMQLRVGGSERVVRSFRRSDPVTALLDVAAQALAKSDGKDLASPFDVIAPGGRPLLKAGVVVAAAADGGDGSEGAAAAAAGAGEEGAGGPTIGSEQLGGASVIVRRT